MFDNLAIGQYVEVMLTDGTVIAGTLEKIERDYVIVDDEQLSGDWVFIEFRNIRRIKCKDGQAGISCKIAKEKE